MACDMLFCWHGALPMKMAVYDCSGCCQWCKCISSVISQLHATGRDNVIALVRYWHRIIRMLLATTSHERTGIIVRDAAIFGDCSSNCRCTRNSTARWVHRLLSCSFNWQSSLLVKLERYLLLFLICYYMSRSTVKYPVGYSSCCKL